MTAASGGAGAAPRQSLVLARIGGLHIGVPVGWVSGATASGAPLATLPRRQGAVAGLLPTPEGCVPVVDLARWVDLPEAELAPELQITEPLPAYLTLRQGTQRLALRVDELLGLRRVPAEQLQRLHHRDEPEELFDAVLSGEGPHEPAICLLEPRRLMRLLSIWCEDMPAAVGGADAATSRSGRAPACRLAIVRTGTRLLAVDMRHVAELMPMPPLKTRLAPGGPSAGFVAWRDGTLAILHPGWALAEQDVSSPPPPLALVVCDETGRAMALPVDELLGTEALPAETLAAETDAPAWHGRRWMDAGRPVVCLEVPALLDALPESGLARSRATRGTPAGLRNDRPYFVLQAGPTVALPIDDVLGMVAAGPLPAGQSTLNWRQRTLALHRAGASSSAMVAIVEQAGGEPAAVCIDRLIGLVPAGAGEIAPLPGRPDAQMLCLPAQAASYAILRGQALLAA